MKNLLILFLFLPVLVFGQKQIKQEIQLNDTDQISMYFKWPDQIIIKYHDKKSVLIEGTVSINYGRYDDAFSVVTEQEGNVLRIQGQVHGLDTMEQITVVRDQNGSGQHTKTIHGKYYSNGDGEMVSTGVMMEIYLTVHLPVNTPAVVESKFGLIEIPEARGPLVANSKFGGVDITIDEKAKVDLKASTAFGDIFTNLAADFRGNGELDKVGKWHRISTSFSGGGRAVEVESKFGNIYLRKK